MQFKARIVSWGEIEEWCDRMRHKVMEDYSPDTIIGIARGGLVPARILSDRMWIKDLLSVKTEHWGITATKDGAATLKSSVSSDIKGKKVLLVDDITDTGESLRVASQHVASLEPSELKTATMLHISRSKLVPDFFAQEVDEKSWTWFIFPWNVYEDLDNLVGRSLVGSMTTSEIGEVLRQDYELNTESVNLEKVLEEFARGRKITNEGGKWSKAS